MQRGGVYTNQTTPHPHHKRFPRAKMKITEQGIEACWVHKLGMWPVHPILPPGGADEIITKQGPTSNSPAVDWRFGENFEKHRCGGHGAPPPPGPPPFELPIPPPPPHHPPADPPPQVLGSRCLHRPVLPRSTSHGTHVADISEPYPSKHENTKQQTSRHPRTQKRMESQPHQHFDTRVDPSCSLHKATNRVLYWIGTAKTMVPKKTQKCQNTRSPCLDKPLLDAIIIHNASILVSERICFVQSRRNTMYPSVPLASISTLKNRSASSGPAYYLPSVLPATVT